MNQKTLLSLLILLLPNIILFGPLLIQGQMFAYRDSARFYYRQFEWNRSQWQQGEIPLWNAQENLGVPVVDEASSSVFYPLQILFLIPGISVSAAFVLYAAIHVYLAGVGTFCFARQLGCRHSGALLAGLGFSLSGSYIFQTSNIVFLVGGCWLPFGLWMSWRLVERPRLSSTLWFGLFLALAVLGGDPQTSYHVVLLAAILLVWQFACHKKNREAFQFRRSLSLHLLAVVMALGLSAIQVFPSSHAARNSTRAYTDRARTVWELTEVPTNTWLTGMLGHPEPATHHDHLYQFSQPPWSWMELIWPNVSGQIGNRNSRWAECLPGASRTWTPSLYCGLAVMVFFLSGICRRIVYQPGDVADHQRLSDRWLKTSLVLFGLGSLGWYGIGWVVHEISWTCFGIEPSRIPLGAPVGGVYWFLVVFLPGYVNFRYPAKMFLVATLLICLLAGLEWQRIAKQQQIQRIRRFTLGMLMFSVLVWIGLFLFSLPLNQWFSLLAARTTSEWGPFDPDQAWASILGGILHACCIGVAVLMMISFPAGQRFQFAGFILLTMLDLVVANQRLLVPARASLWNRPATIVEDINQTTDGMVRFFRTDPMIWSTKNQWLQRPAGNRLEQIVDFEVQTMMPRHHLAQQHESGKIGLLESFRSIESTDWATLMAWLKQSPGIRTNDSYNVQLAPDLQSLGLLGCRYLIIPKWGKPSLPEQSILAANDYQEELLVRNPYDQGRFRLVETINWIEPIKDLPSWLRQTDNQRLLRQQTGYGGHYDRALVESSGAKPIRKINNPTNGLRASDSGNNIQVVRESPTEIELLVTAASGMLVIADRFDEDWSAYLIEEDGSQTEIPLLRTDLVLRGIPIDALGPRLPGKASRIRLAYRPRWVIRGAWVSASTILVYLLAFVGGAWRARSGRSADDAV